MGQAHAHKSSSNAICFPFHVSGMRGPTQSIFPCDLHAGQKIASLSNAIVAPLMLPALLAEITLPPAEVDAPSVIV
jgi:hypothetical protein